MMRRWNNKIKLVLITCFCSSALVLVSCPDKHRAERGIKVQKAELEGGPSSGGDYDMPPRPEVSESALLLMKIDTLINNENPLVKLTSDQKRELTPTLMEWRDELERGNDKASAAYINMIESMFNAAQREFRPEPEGPPGFGGGDRPQGPPPGDVQAPADGKAGGGAADHPAPPADRVLMNMIIDRLS